MINRFPHLENFSTMHNHGLVNAKLSWKARGIFAYLLTKPNHWEVMISHLVNSAPDGREAVRSALKELETQGYITREDQGRKAGQFDGSGVILHEFPQVGTGDGLAVDGSPVNGSAVDGQSPPSKDSIPSITELATTDPPTSENAGVAAEKKRVITKARGSLFDAVLTATDFDTENATTSERKRVGKAVKDLLERPGPPTAEDVAEMARRYRERKMDDGRPFPLGPESMIKNWNTFAPKRRVLVVPTGEMLERSLLWDVYYADPDYLTKMPTVPDPFVAPDGRTYTSHPSGPNLKRIWDDER